MSLFSPSHVIGHIFLDDVCKGHDKLVFKLVKNNLVTPSVSDVSVSYAVSKFHLS